MKPKYDILWKGMIEVVMADLLLFVDPDIGQEVDLERGFEFLDKELSAIYPEGKAKTKVVDKLVKAFLRDGTERFILLHVEVQGKNGKDFPERMFQYFVRLIAKHGHSVAAIAVLTGKDGNDRPGIYEYSCLWSRARYEYKTICIAEYSDEALSASLNPFAAVIQVAKEVLMQVKGTEDERDFALLEEKTRMAMLLREKMAVFGEQKTEAILAFLNNYLVFKNPEINLIFMKRTDNIFEKENTMGIIEQLAEIRHQEGVEEGLEKAVRALLTKREFSSQEIAELLDVPMALVEKVRKKSSISKGLPEYWKNEIEQMPEIERLEGFEEARKVGIQIVMKRTVRNLLAAGELSPNKIAEILEVLLDFVEQIKAEMGAQ